LKLQLDRFLEHEITFIYFTDENLFTVSGLRTLGIQWQPDSMTSVLAIFRVCILLWASL